MTLINLHPDWMPKQLEMFEWCKSNFGRGGWTSGEQPNWAEMGTWCVDCAYGHTIFMFRNEADAVIFKARWGLLTH